MKRPTLGALVLIAVVGSACGGGRDEVAVTAVAAAYDRTQAAGSARVEMDMSMSGGGQEITLTAAGAFDMKRQVSRATMHLPSIGGQAATDVEIVQRGSVAYYRGEAFTRSFGADTEWVSMNFSEFMPTNPYSFQDPAKTLEVLREIAPDVEDAGFANVRGVSTTHYRGTTTFGALAEDVPAADDPRFREMFERLAGVEIPIDVWIDDHSLTRRIGLGMDFSDALPESAGGFRMAMTMDFFDFGVPVEVRVPPPSEVTEIDLTGRTSVPVPA